MARESPELATKMTLVSKSTEQHVDPLNSKLKFNVCLPEKDLIVLLIKVCMKFIESLLQTEGHNLMKFIFSLEVFEWWRNFNLLELIKKVIY